MNTETMLLVAYILATCTLKQKQTMIDAIDMKLSHCPSGTEEQNQVLLYAAHVLEADVGQATQTAYEVDLFDAGIIDYYQLSPAAKQLHWENEKAYTAHLEAAEQAFLADVLEAQS